MHKLPSSSAVRRFRLASILLCAKCILTPAVAGFLVFASIKGDKDLMRLGIGAAVITVTVVFFQWLVSSRTHCPLCLTPVLAKKRCVKHKHARSFLGSHRLRVAIGVLFAGAFRCPYCNEPSRIEVRQRKRHRDHSGS
jgi:hypothetical protein